MGIRFLSCAEGELAEAVEYYNEQNPGLGYDFIAEVKKTFTRIADYPNAWLSISKRTRRCRVSRFPYAVIYQHREDGILVVAVMHMSRRPGSWRERV